MSTNTMIFVCTENVLNVDYIDIDFSSASFSFPPIINASAVGSNVSVFVTNITSSTARLNFSSKFTGQVTYILSPKTS